jgi:hypothetical protein
MGSGAAVASGGFVGAAANSAGETVIGASTQSSFITLSNFLGTAGQTSLFNAPSNLTALALTSQITTSGGNGDAGLNYGVGNSILATSISPLIPGGVNATVAGSNGGNGGNGITSWKPFYSLGGAGGGSSFVGAGGAGGNGGNGGIGSGGGGAGSGTLGGGTGGKGGDGLVMIISF